MFGVLGGFYYMIFTIIQWSLSRYIEFQKDYQLLRRIYSTETDQLNTLASKYKLKQETYDDEIFGQIYEELCHRQKYTYNYPGFWCASILTCFCRMKKCKDTICIEDRIVKYNLFKRNVKRAKDELDIINMISSLR
jgi:hypothetical protein